MAVDPLKAYLLVALVEAIRLVLTAVVAEVVKAAKHIFYQQVSDSLTHSSKTFKTISPRTERPLFYGRVVLAVLAEVSVA